MRSSLAKSFGEVLQIQLAVKEWDLPHLASAMGGSDPYECFVCLRRLRSISQGWGVLDAETAKRLTAVLGGDWEIFVGGDEK